MKVLMKLRNYDQTLVQAELDNLDNEKFRLSQQAKVKWSDFWTDESLRRPLIVTIVIQMSQQVKIYEKGSHASFFFSRNTVNNCISFALVFRHKCSNILFDKYF